jgi:hypothetical protein
MNQIEQALKQAGYRTPQAQLDAAADDAVALAQRQSKDKPPSAILVADIIWHSIEQRPLLLAALFEKYRAAELTALAKAAIERARNTTVRKVRDAQTIYDGRKGTGEGQPGIDARCAGADSGSQPTSISQGSHRVTVSQRGDGTDAKDGGDQSCFDAQRCSVPSVTPSSKPGAVTKATRPTFAAGRASIIAKVGAAAALRRGIMATIRIQGIPLYKCHRDAIEDWVKKLTGADAKLGEALLYRMPEGTKQPAGDFISDDEADKLYDSLRMKSKTE